MKKIHTYLQLFVLAFCASPIIAAANITSLDTETILQEGVGYQLKEIAYLDENGETRYVELYYINNVEGATNAYNEAGLPLAELLEIEEEVENWGGGWVAPPTASANKLSTINTTFDETEQFTWVIDKRGATINSSAENDLYVQEYNLEHIIAEEQQYPNGDLLTSSTSISTDFSAKLFGCSGWREKSRGFNKNVSEDFSHNKTIGSGIATLNFKGELDVEADIDLDLKYSYKRNFFCLPYKFRFKNLEAKANYEAQGNFSITGKIEKNFGNSSWNIAEPKVFDFWFAVGPIPVRVAGKLPIEVGTGDIVVSVTGEIATTKPLHFKGNLHYTCTGAGCIKHSSNHENLNTDISNSIGASLSAKVTLKPYIQVAIKPYLYGEWFLYAKFGIKPFFPIELFGYYGNTCQDGDNDGGNETVAAVLATLAFEVGITGEAKIFNSYILRPRYWSLWYKDLTMIDFLKPGSSAFSPLIRPQAQSDSLNITLPVSIRSCVASYANRFPVDYTIDWGDGTFSTLNDVATSKQLNHTYNFPGTYWVNVSYENGITTSAPVTVSDGGWGGGW